MDLLPGFIYLIILSSLGFLVFLMRRKYYTLDSEKEVFLREKEVVLDFMHDILRAIGEGIPRDQLYRRVVHAAVKATGATSSVFFEMRENHLFGVSMEGLFPLLKGSLDSHEHQGATRAHLIEEIFHSEVFQLGEGVIGHVAQTRVPFFSPDSARRMGVDDALQVRSLIVVPVNFRKELFGVLAVSKTIEGDGFKAADFSLIKSLSAQAAVAFHNLNLMEVQIAKSKLDMDLTLASSIQAMVLRRQYPQVEHLDLDARYLPAQKVGGDLYDIFELDEGRIGFAVADVSGKGFPASLLMAICQTHLRHFAYRSDSPSEVIAAINAAMQPEMRRDMFITMVYAIVDIRQQTLTLARAGHELPLLWKAGNSLTQPMELKSIKSKGMAIGMVGAEVFDSVIEDVESPVKPGDLLLLYTDGITESANPDGLEFSFARLADTIRAYADYNAHDLNQKILDQLAHFTVNARQTDDITLLTAKIL